jgi:hypothetical protein
MPAIVATSMAKGKPRASTRTTLGASGNSIPYVKGQGQILVLHNATVGSLTPTINGSGNVAAEIEGAGEINFASGLSLGAIAVGAQLLVNLDFISQYLNGTIDITSGTGLVATLLNR